MKPGLYEVYPIISDAIDQPMFFRNSAGPSSGTFVTKRFRFSYPIEGITHDRLNKFENLKQNLTIVFGPVLKVFAKLGFKDRLSLPILH